MYFQVKNILKNNHNHTFKHPEYPLRVNNIMLSHLLLITAKTNM
jgi:hypothetical protein